MPERFCSIVRVAALVGSAVAGGFAGPQAASAAQLTYTAQTRTVSTSAYTGTPQSASAPDFSAFNVTVTSTGTTAGNTASTTQRSQLLPTQITFASESSGTRTTQSPANNITGRSELSATFTLDVDSPYAFDLNQTSATLFGFCSVTLTNLSNNATTFSAFLPFPVTITPPSSFNTSGTLAAGSYRLAIRYSDGTSMGILSFSGGFDATLAVPEPASLGLIATGVGVLSRRRPRPA